MCGECVEDFGPSVNTVAYDCVNCSGGGTNVLKYLALVYLPLATFFTALIVFDIRLTTGPANAFIVYAQVVSSTFSLDADGQVPLNRLAVSVKDYEFLLKSYRVIYGIFNLEFLENLLPPLCFSTSFNTLTVLLLDYGVAVFPLFMILIVVVLCLRMKECCSSATRSIREHVVPRGWRCSCRWNTRSINEALLPAFAAFLLLSYTKFSLTSSYIIGTQPLIDENGIEKEPFRVYYAGYLTSDDPGYVYPYLIPSSVVFAIFVCITPLLLLFYPLQAFEWCLSLVAFLWRWYPADKIHVFLDAFQGCYRNNMRFFAGLYFLFRLAINAIYLATNSWLQQFVAQQIACVMMVTLVAVCRPYNKENWLFNYVDVLIFADLAMVNALSLYLYTTTAQSNLTPSLSAFVFQYILVFLPLIYMLSYVAWYVVTRTWLKEKLPCCNTLKRKVYEPLTSIV